MTETDLQYIAAADFEAPKTPYPNIKLTITLFFVILLNMLLVAIPACIIMMAAPKMPYLEKSLFNLLMYVAPMLLSINYAFRKSEKQQRYLLSINFNRTQGWLIPMVIIGTLALIIPLIWVSNLIPMPVSVKKIFEQIFTKDIFSIATVCIAAPILEEILCRGIVLKGLLKNYPPFKAIIISALFFGLIHLNPWQAIPAFIGGMYMGWVYYKTQSVIPGMIIHFTINFTSSMLLFLPERAQDLRTFFGLYGYILAMLASVIIFAGVLAIIYKNVKAVPGNFFKSSPDFPPSV